MSRNCNINIRQYGIEYIENCPKFSDCYLKDNIPNNICPILLHTVVPYYVTYLYGGNFTWSKKIGHVDVQCPNPEGRVAVDIINNEFIYLVIKSSENICPIKYEVGLKVNISEVFKMLCPFIYDVAFPWMQLGIKNPIVLRCPGCPESKGVKFLLRCNCENK